MSNYLEAQKRLIEEKKRDVLARSSYGKSGEIPGEADSKISVPSVTPNRPSLFVNDGNFLARFQAMHNQKSLSGNETASVKIEDGNTNSGKVTMKLSNAKRKDQPKVLQPSRIASSAFESPTSSVFPAEGRYEMEAKGAVKAPLSNQSHAAIERNAPKSRENLGALETSSQSSSLGNRKRKNRWDEQVVEESFSTAGSSSKASALASLSASASVSSASASSASASTSSALNAAVQGSSSTSGPADIMAEFERAKALVQQRAAQARGFQSAQDIERQRQIEQQKEIEAMYRRIIEEQAIEAKKRSKNSEEKPRYQYDSDEDTEEGTWEHKKRLKEMEKTRLEANKLTEQAQGKHHMADFLPKEELARFQEKVKAIKEGRKADLSDYAEFKIKEDNIGFKLLQKAGWKEGKGLGSEGKGITEPINKGQTSLDNSGVGVEKPQEVEKDDDEFDIYRKRMMLAYKFRPNPLNNPRRPYY